VYLIEKYFFKERRGALRIRFWRMMLKHRTSYPYLSGDAFANLCDYAAYGKDGSQELDLRKLRKAKKLFVPGYKLNKLLEEHFEDISATVLICGNSDENFTLDLVLPNSVKLWLCQNYAVENGVGSVLPIGLENLRLGKSGFKRYQKQSKGFKVEDKILLPPMQITNPIRAEVLEACKCLPQVYDVRETYLGTKNYFELLKEYKFVLVLEGNGFDTHRLWEVLYKGSTPLLFDSPWSRNIYEAGFPVCIIDKISESNLAAAYQYAQKNESISETKNMLTMTYWEILVGNHV
jgi:hypothetical protein